ncbi:Crp/Fnr family transcriptional regulator [Corticibacter populi]|uniref:Crp/Fnr family transcriptional regulator n=1 Tax=Corticibacter populi TaxID=1550736 RepID=A0A3M6QKD8_9BURK|nr:Crp/Fnr family transcriptional regulator [Corticibacter populi]RMX03493.1 Crp/Fnr family transcriptional regulator [Corticibacter populi]RZS29937.1 CRP-like cAMP-binding protein [Corticibacter populi]
MSTSGITELLRSRRAPTPQELDGIPWLHKLQPRDRKVVQSALEVGEIQVGGHVCREGRPVRHWLGLIDGLLKVSNDRRDGQTITYMGVPAGSWFGEGTALKRECYRYDVQALRRSTIAALPLEQFHWLVDNSIEFNRTIMYQLNERVAQFFVSRETDRINNPEMRVARTLVGLFNPILAPGVGEVLRITQQELAGIVGLSRQRVNQALTRLAGQGLIRIDYGSLQVLDLAALHAY